MRPIAHTSVAISESTNARWELETTAAKALLADAGLAVDATEHEQHVLDDGRLRVTLHVGEAFSITLHAEPGDWSEVAAN